MINLAEIYSTHKQGFYSLALSITRNSAEAEDAVHDAIAKLAKRQVTPKGDPASYVYATVRNAALDRIRKRKRIVDCDDFIFADSECTLPAPGSNLIKEESNFIIRKEIEKLDEPQREVIVMKIYGNLTFEEIAEIRAEPLSTVSSRYARTLKSLKSKMESLIP